MKNTRPDFEVRALHVKPIISLFFALFVVLILSTQSSPALAEHCWLYVDGDFKTRQTRQNKPCKQHKTSVCVRRVG